MYRRLQRHTVYRGDKRFCACLPAVQHYVLKGAPVNRSLFSAFLGHDDLYECRRCGVVYEIPPPRSAKRLLDQASILIQQGMRHHDALAQIAVQKTEAARLAYAALHDTRYKQNCPDPESLQSWGLLEALYYEDYNHPLILVWIECARNYIG